MTNLLIVLSILGAYGAVEAFLRLVRTSPKAWKWAVRKWKHRIVDDTFYYKEREYAYRIHSDGNTFSYARRERVVALAPLMELPISYRWTGQGTFQESIKPNQYALADAARVPGQLRVRKIIRLDSELQKGKEISYIFSVRCVRNGTAPEPFIGSFSSHRVDRLILRAIFDGPPPARAFFVTQNGDGVELSRSPVNEYDEITGEYRCELADPEPHKIYLLRWEE